jgi:putative transposase
MNRKAYKSDLSEEQWQIIEPLIPPAKPGGHPRTVDLREVVNAIFYVLRTGCRWEMLPHDLPPYSLLVLLLLSLAEKGSLAKDE